MSATTLGEPGVRLGFGVRIVTIVLGAYRLAVSPLLGPLCRFEPSCSRYAEQAIERYGLLEGGRRAVGRLLRCHPWNPGGYDPVEAERKCP